MEAYVTSYQVAEVESNEGKTEKAVDLDKRADALRDADADEYN